VPTREERNVRQRFGERYGEERIDATEAIEREVIGLAWGACGYTTVGQAHELVEHLALGPGQRLLDLGAGRGWPGLYLAVRSGCSVVLTDVPLEGLRGALQQAAHERVADRVTAVASTARALPLRDATFDAVVHTDVLC
jgi:methylase of polypeptide subunit release factors